MVIFYLPILILFDAWEWVRDSLQLLARRDRVARNILASALPAPSVTRFAIVAWMPDKFGTVSVKHLLAALKAQNFSVVLVANRAPPSTVLDDLRGLYDHVIQRLPVGRDFGSFKCGLDWLRNSGSLENAQAILLANDSLFYSQRGTRRLVAEMCESADDWTCMYASHADGYHAQSFLQMFRAPVVNSDAFKRFWKRYQSRSSRRHCILRGELGLSRALLAAGFVPTAVYNSTRVSADVMQAIEARSNDEEFEEVVSASLPYPFSGHEIRSLRAMDAAPARISTMIAVRMERENPTHAVGMICNRLYEAPLKKDLAYRGTTTVSHIMRFASGFSKDELALIDKSLRLRQKPTNPFERVLQRYGRL